MPRYHNRNQSRIICLSVMVHHMTRAIRWQDSQNFPSANSTRGKKSRPAEAGNGALLLGELRPVSSLALWNTNCSHPWAKNRYNLSCSLCATLSRTCLWTNQTCRQNRLQMLWILEMLHVVCAIPLEFRVRACLILDGSMFSNHFALIF